MLSKKDIIESNKRFHDGIVVNQSSLDYAVSTQARSRNWLRTASIIIRSIAVDHVFADGNKRTAAVVLMSIMEINKIAFDPESIAKIIHHISKNNMHNVRQIERCLKDVIRIR